MTTGLAYPSEASPYARSGGGGLGGQMGGGNPFGGYSPQLQNVLQSRMQQAGQMGGGNWMAPQFQGGGQRQMSANQGMGGGGMGGQGQTAQFAGQMMGQAGQRQQQPPQQQQAGGVPV
jgi:hypothetical protein